MIDLQTSTSEVSVIQQMKSAHTRLGGSLAELGRELKAWQATLGRGRFKRAYHAAGWTEDEVYSCFRALRNQQHAADKCQPQCTENTNSQIEVHFSNESDEWYTPTHILEGVVEALGEIDLDPCSNPGKNVPARKHFVGTAGEDGLRQPWSGRVYMNPPYSNIADWTRKLLVEHASGAVSEAIALVPARVDTTWFRPFSRVVFISGRLKFSNSENSAPFPSALVYLGRRWKKFKQVFEQVGAAWRKESAAADWVRIEK